MLGFYENFPKNIHRIAQFKVSASKKKLQKALAKTLHELNSQTSDLEDVANPSLRRCTVVFEFGFAEASNFSYLDFEEMNKVLKAVNNKPFRVMDFFCAIRYYKAKDKKKPLKFDYYMLRFTFDKKSTEIQVFHERGPRHVSPEEVVDFIANKINETFPRKMLKALTTS